MVEHLWFGDEDGRTPEEAAFLTELRRQACTWTVPGLDPQEETSSLTLLTPLYVDLGVPGLDDAPVNFLEVAYWGTTPAQSQLQGAWGAKGYLLDGPSNPGDLEVKTTGVAAAPEQLARWAAEWMLRQLQRPVLRQDWLSGDQVAASAWRWADDGGSLASTGPRRSRRRPADRQVLAWSGEAGS
ncbi:hypothetical protein [Kineococcus sp. SYSU DK005]|uniref:hypothetical protein n=1 Tax=Kineococcus sp. SYSU DK005 TaxID=3383126 RepID=UPI003D7C60CD